jgi:predicted Zn finger-like uncharacterized protein
MLVTTCTHCLARFRVTPQQLNARSGQVRCGRCNQVFSGFEALERFPDDDTGARLLAAREAAERAAAAGPSAAPPEPAPEHLPEVRAVDDPPIPAPQPAYVEPPATPSTPMRRAERARATQVHAYEDTEPEPPRRPSRAWVLGAFLLALLLAAEAAYALRMQIAQRYPQARPYLQAACARVGCTVPWPRNEQLLKLEDSDLLEVPGRSGEIALTLRLRNMARVAQEYPFVELTLTDVTGQAAARRVLKPADYLGHPLRQDEVLAAGADVAVQLRLATPRMKATGYQLLLFYP